MKNKEIKEIKAIKAWGIKQGYHTQVCWGDSKRISFFKFIPVLIKPLKGRRKPYGK